MEATMSSRHAIKAAAGILVLAAVLTAGWLASTTMAQDAAPATIRIGHVVPMTGPDAPIGEHYRISALMATKEINDQGGIFVKKYNKKIPVELIQYDDEGSPAVSVRMTERLVNRDGVVAMICGYKTSIGMQQSTAIERLKMPCITGGWASSAIFNRGYKYIFTTVNSVMAWSRSTIDFLKAQIDAGRLPKPTRIALAVENTEHGKDYRAGATERIGATPDYFVLALDEGFEPQRTDFSGLLGKVASAKADAFLVDAGFSDFVTMHRQVMERRLRFRAVSYGVRGTEKEAREALGRTTDNLFVIVPWSPALPYKSSRDFVTKWNAFTNGRGPQVYSAVGYEAARVLYRAIEKAGTLDRDAIRDTIARWDERETLLPGGRTAFMPNGLPNYPLLVAQVMPPDGKPVIVWPDDAREREPVLPTQ
jgi:branched-chain amino acid transport system substrate-binding protein